MKDLVVLLLPRAQLFVDRFSFFLCSKAFSSTIVCYTAVFSVITQRSSLRDDSKNGCVADFIHQSAGLNRRKTLWGRVLVVTATSFPGFSPTRPTERERGQVGENPGNEVVVTAVNEGWQKNSSLCRVDSSSVHNIQMGGKLYYLNAFRQHAVFLFSKSIEQSARGWRRLARLPSLRLSPPFFLRDSRASETRLFSRGVIFTPARVSLALLSLRKNGELLVVYPSLNLKKKKDCSQSKMH